jgi:hypothetical protein
MGAGPGWEAGGAGQQRAGGVGAPSNHPRPAAARAPRRCCRARCRSAGARRRSSSSAAPRAAARALRWRGRVSARSRVVNHRCSRRGRRQQPQWVDSTAPACRPPRPRDPLPYPAPLRPPPPRARTLGRALVRHRRRLRVRPHRVRRPRRLEQRVGGLLAGEHRERVRVVKPLDARREAAPSEVEQEELEVGRRDPPVEAVDLDDVRQRRGAGG